MQPYFFPYIGYYQLIKAVDNFIFYDDVNFIKRGWINRTNIITREGKQLLSISLLKSSQNKRINEIELAGSQDKLLKTIEFTYKKAPYFKDFYPVVESVIRKEETYISEYAANSIKAVAAYLDLDIEFSNSSEFHRSTAGYEKARRLIDICRKENADIYINSIGGQAIYSKEEFDEKGIELYFLQSNPKITYDQRPIRNDFEPSLSMIDVLMFNAPEQALTLLEDYKLI